MKDKLTSVDKNTISDTGSESVKYFNQQVKFVSKSIKTVNTSYKTSKKLVGRFKKSTVHLIRFTNKKFKRIKKKRKLKKYKKYNFVKRKFQRYRIKKILRKSTRSERRRRFFKKTVKIGNRTRRATADVTKSLEKSLNPFRKELNENSVSDTGRESLKYLYKQIGYGEKAIKTVNKTVKTTKKTIKTVVNAPKNIKKFIQNTKRTIKTTVRVVKTTVKTVKVVVQVTVKVVSQAAAALTNPYVLIILLAIFLIIYIINSLGVIFAGYSTVGEAKVKERYYTVGGLTNVPEDIKFALGLIDERHSEYRDTTYNPLIDNLHYDSNDLPHSDLVYLEYFKLGANADEPSSSFGTSLADDNMKETLKSQLKWEDGISDYSIVSIAYVLEEKLKNKSYPGSTFAIQTVNYSPDVIEEIINNCIQIETTTYENTECSRPKCSTIEEVTHNYTKDEYWEITEHLHEAYIEWVKDDGYKDLIEKYLGLPGAMPSDAKSAYWDSFVSAPINDWFNKYGMWSRFDDDGIYVVKYNLNNYRENLHDQVVNTSYYENVANATYSLYSQYFDDWENMEEDFIDYKPYCPHEHTLKAMRVSFLSKEAIMDKLNFTEADKIWEKVTEEYLMANYRFDRLDTDTYEVNKK